MKEFEFDRKELSDQLLKDYLEDEEVAGAAGVKKTRRFNVKFFLLSAIVVLSAGFFIFAWRTDKFALTSNHVDELPLVRADQTPVKIKPEDPGGVKIANMDKTVYNSIDSEKEKTLPKVTRILPAPEEPVKRAEITLQPVQTEKAETTVADKPTSQEPVLNPKEDAAKLAKTEPASGAKTDEQTKLALADMAKAMPESIPEKERVEADKAVSDSAKMKALTPADVKVIPVPKQKKLVVPKAKTVKGYRVQLGAYRSMGDLSAKWAKLNKMFPGLFKDMQKFTEKADLGEKGIFYRLQVGPVKDADEARVICQKLIDKNQGCFFVKK